MLRTPSEELAWAAGFFDGEGCVGYSLRKPRKPGFASVLEVHATIGQIDREVLDRFAGALGVGKVYGPEHRDPPRRPVYTWRTCSKPAVRAVYDALSPYLSSIKREAFEKVLEMVEDRKNTQHERLSLAAKKRMEERKTKCLEQRKML